MKMSKRMLAVFCTLLMLASCFALPYGVAAATDKTSAQLQAELYPNADASEPYYVVGRLQEKGVVAKGESAKGGSGGDVYLDLTTPIDLSGFDRSTLALVVDTKVNRKDGVTGYNKLAETGNQEMKLFNGGTEILSAGWLKDVNKYYHHSAGEIQTYVLPLNKSNYVRGDDSQRNAVTKLQWHLYNDTFKVDTDDDEDTDPNNNPVGLDMEVTNARIVDLSRDGQGYSNGIVAWYKENSEINPKADNPGGHQIWLLEDSPEINNIPSGAKAADYKLSFEAKAEVYGYVQGSDGNYTYHYGEKPPAGAENVHVATPSLMVNGRVVFTWISTEYRINQWSNSSNAYGNAKNLTENWQTYEYSMDTFTSEDNTNGNKLVDMSTLEGYRLRIEDYNDNRPAGETSDPRHALPLNVFVRNAMIVRKDLATLNEAITSLRNSLYDDAYAAALEQVKVALLDPDVTDADITAAVNALAAGKAVDHSNVVVGSIPNWKTKQPQTWQDQYFYDWWDSDISPADGSTYLDLTDGETYVSQLTGETRGVIGANRYAVATITLAANAPTVTGAKLRLRSAEAAQPSGGTTERRTEKDYWVDLKDCPVVENADGSKTYTIEWLIDASGDNWQGGDYDRRVDWSRLDWVQGSFYYANGTGVEGAMTVNDMRFEDRTVQAITDKLDELATMNGDYIYVPTGEGAVSKPTSMLVLGDSIAAGDGVGGELCYGGLLRDALGLVKDVNYLNNAVGGATSDVLLKEIGDKTNLTWNPDMVSISIGGNDVLLPMAGASQVDNLSMRFYMLTQQFNSADAEQLAAEVLAEQNKYIEEGTYQDEIDAVMSNLRSIVDYLLNKYPDTTIVLQTVYNPYDYSEQLCLRLPVIEQFNDSIKDLAAKYDQVVVLDVFEGFRGKGGQYVGNDFIHPNHTGHTAIAELYKKLWKAEATGDGAGLFEAEQVAAAELLKAYKDGDLTVSLMDLQTELTKLEKMAANLVSLKKDVAHFSGQEYKKTVANVDRSQYYYDWSTGDGLSNENPADLTDGTGDNEIGANRYFQLKVTLEKNTAYNGTTQINDLTNLLRNVEVRFQAPDNSRPDGESGECRSASFTMSVVDTVVEGDKITYTMEGLLNAVTESTFDPKDMNWEKLVKCLIYVNMNQELRADGTDSNADIPVYCTLSDVKIVNKTKALKKAELEAAVKERLDAAYAEGEALDAYNAALKAAKALLKDEGAYYSDLQKALQALRDAKAELKLIMGHTVKTFDSFNGTVNNGFEDGYTNRDWQWDNISRTDLTMYDLNNLVFRMNVRLSYADGSLVVPDGVATPYFDEASFRLRSRDPENNDAEEIYMARDVHFNWGDNAYEVALKDMVQDGGIPLMNLSRVEQARLVGYIYQNGQRVYDPEHIYMLTITNARIVDIGAEKSLGSKVNDEGKVESTVKTVGNGMINITGGLAYGTDNTLTAATTADEALGKFVGWKKNDTFVAANGVEDDLILPVNGKQDVTAYFAAADETVVVYTGKYNRVIKVQVVKDAAELKIPDAPTITGQTFTGWSVEGDALAAAVDGAKGGFTTVSAVYKTNTEAAGYTVNLTGTTDDTTQTNQTFDTRITVTAATDEGFSYWAVNGKIAGYEDTLTFYVSGDMDVVAVYGEAATPELSAGITQADMVADGNGAYTFSIIAQTYLPEGYDLMEYGVVFAPSADYFETMDPKWTLDVASSSRIPNRQYKIDLFSVKSGKTRAAIAYITARDADGEVITVYSDAVSKVAE